MATSLGEEGLIVPVIKGADNLSLLAMARAVNDLANRARSKKLQPDDVKGGTFTLTNHGISGSLFAFPVINQPQCGILGVGAMQKRVVVIELMRLPSARWCISRLCSIIASWMARPRMVLDEGQRDTGELGVIAMTKEQDRPNISPKVHPPIVALMFIVIAYFLGRFAPLPFSAPTILRYIRSGTEFRRVPVGRRCVP